MFRVHFTTTVPKRENLKRSTTQEMGDAVHEQYNRTEDFEQQKNNNILVDTFFCLFFSTFSVDELKVTECDFRHKLN